MLYVKELKMTCKLCGLALSKEDVIPDQKYQICDECEVKLEYGN